MNYIATLKHQNGQVEIVWCNTRRVMFKSVKGAENALTKRAATTVKGDGFVMGQIKTSTGEHVKNIAF